MNFRVRLTLGALMVIAITIVLSTIGVSYLVRKQNDENAKSQILRGVKFVTRSLTDAQRVSLRRVSEFTGNPTNIINFRYLMEIKGKKDSADYKFILEQPEEDMVAVLLEMVRERNLDGVWGYDGDGDLVLSVHRMGDEIETGIATTDAAGARTIKFQNTTGAGMMTPNWSRKPLERNSETEFKSPFPDGPESGFETVRGKLAMTGVSPVIAKDLYLEKKERKIGCIRFYKFLNGGLADRLAKGTEMEVAVYSGDKLTAGTMQHFKDLPRSLTEKFERRRSDGDLASPPIQVVQEGETEYYRAIVPIFSSDVFVGAIALNLSREDTLRKTRENIILLIFVMAVCMLIVVPVAIFISGQFSGRIIRILSVVKGFTRGDLSARIDVRGGDEVGILARAFNHMAQALQESVEELRASEDKYRTLFENSGVALIFIEADTTISICNKEFEELGGYSKSEVEGRKKWPDFVAKREDLERMLEYHRLRRIDPQAAPQTYEFQLVDRQGRLKDIVITVTAMLGTRQSLAALLDITERKRAEEERARLVTAIEQSAEAIFITDADGIIRYVNPAFERMTGYGRKEAIGLHTGLLKSETHDETLYKAMRTSLSRGQVWSGRLTIKRKDGAFYEADVTASPVRDGSSAIISYVSIHRDITNEVKLERELRQMQKMEAIGALAGGIAHDFNNILTAIIGYAQIARSKVPQGNAAQRHLEQVLNAGYRATDLVNQILTFSRQKEQERIPVQVALIVKEVLKLLRSSIPATIEIRHDSPLPPEESMILADPTQIHQVLMNLCTNAAHAMRAKGGVLGVKLSNTVMDVSMVSRYPDLREGRYVCLTVSDTGHGMDSAVVERIFDPYFTTKGVGEGTGLGLSMVQGIVKGCGGAIVVYSEPGRGTVFHVFLPKTAAHAAKDVEEAEEIPTGTERILFVDDEETLVDLGKEMLEALGYDVCARLSSVEALETFRARPEAFDLVVTDLTMPGLTGRELAEKIMAVRPEMPIVLCTGFSELMNEKQAKEAGIREFVMKPYQLNILAKTVRNALDAE